MTPQTLDHAGIAARIPHSGNMCLLDRLLRWDTLHIECSASSHQAATNPLRTAGGLLSANAIEYAAQAMALHGVLSANANANASASAGSPNTRASGDVSAGAVAVDGARATPGAAPQAGFLASVRGVRLLVPRLDTVHGALRISATRAAGDATQALYNFSLHDAQGALLVDGRATVILAASLLA